MSGKTITWAATPEAKAKCKGAYIKPDPGWNCDKMKQARRKAEQVYAELKQEQAAVGGSDTGVKEKET